MNPRIITAQNVVRSKVQMLEFRRSGVVAELDS